VLGILMYSHIHSGSCAPAATDTNALATLLINSSEVGE
jgi:hypothetical protein